MEQNILKSTKKVLGIHPDDPSFDEDIAMHINATFSTLDQIGVGPDGGFMIEDGDEEWDDFIGDSKTLLNQVKLYIYLSARILFDPPASSFALDALKEQRDEKGWRLQVQAEDEKHVKGGHL